MEFNISLFNKVFIKFHWFLSIFIESRNDHKLIKWVYLSMEYKQYKRTHTKGASERDRERGT